MENLQTHLLGLLHEIDEICRKYDITYYAAGGTTIGAVRHNGFIPWDDDADLYMTRDNFYRFREAFYKENPKDRVLECLDDNPECPATIPRYIEETTTTLCRFHCMNTCSGGLIIDIFILDPIPGDPEIQEEFLAKFNVYNDLVVPYYIFSQRNEEQYYDLYEKYQQKVKAVGRNAVLKELEEDLFQYREEECSCYVLRWGTLPSIFPKEMMGTPAFFKFEDMKLPVPEKWWDYLYQLYGADWMYIPSPEEATQHVSVVNMEIPYTYYTKKMDVLIDKEEAARNYQLRKDLRIKEQKYKWEWNKKLLQINADYISYAQKKLLLQNSYNLPDMLRDGKFQEIIDIFSCYLDGQCSTYFLGKMRHSYWYRYKHPVFIDITDEALYCLLYSLTAVGQTKKAERIFSARLGLDRALTADLKAMKNLLAAIKCVKNAYYSKRYETAREALEALLPEDSRILEVKKFSLLLEVEEAKTDSDLKHVEQCLKEAICQFPEDVEFLKAQGDILYNQGNFEEAKRIYSKVIPETRNGMLLLDINNKVGMLEAEAQDKADTKATPKRELSSFEKVQLELLKEIDEICRKNGIEYFLYGKTALYAYHKHEFEPELKCNAIVMTPENAIRFVKAASEIMPENRCIDSLTTNANHLSYDLYYVNRDTLYFPISESKIYKDMGIFIKIKILRKNSEKKLKNYVVKLFERLHESYLVRVPSGASSRQKTVKRIGTILMKLCGEKGRKWVSKKLFSFVTKVSMQSKQKEYFVTRENEGLKHIIKVYSVSSFEKKESAVLYDQEFPVPEFVKYKDLVEETRTNNTFLDQRGISRFIDTQMSFKEFAENVDLSQLEGTVREDYEKSKDYQKQLRAATKKTNRYWAIVCRIDDKLKMQKKYEPLKGEIENLYRNKEYNKVLEQLSDYDKLVSYYLTFRLGFCFDQEIFQIYCECLNRMNRAEKAERLLKLVDREEINY